MALEDGLDIAVGRRAEALQPLADECGDRAYSGGEGDDTEWHQ